ncbi:MAG: hypothetical protein JHC19_06680 [Desulfurococcaceae archaeon]|jgi:rRNA-processing protein FCF1|nr:hypothetical protein [Desulfurococcales archaeon]MCI4457740.1 hypothetical protein [Desulfurococcaceae archaeon]
MSKKSEDNKCVLIDTNIFLLIKEGFDVIDNISNELEEKYTCATVDSVIRELFMLAGEEKKDLLISYIEKIFNKCVVYTLSEDYEKENADIDLLRAASIMKIPVITLDKELIKELRKEGIDQILIYKGSDKRIMIR